MSKLQTVPRCNDSRRSNHTLYLCRVVQSKLHAKDVLICNDCSCRWRIGNGVYTFHRSPPARVRLYK
ncbi:uncharacterized protein ARMOST_00007 [Armillaria ostoyae]|uniref:Uncharacterized protein n=1 Tax=Armillaria ostoyae TaxID=47428 RepID=A0A284QJX2_ARMOS|nr:uncharacterized protein ARMOST_00007 [Armillaria ostoyae]